MATTSYSDSRYRKKRNENTLDDTSAKAATVPESTGRAASAAGTAAGQLQKQARGTAAAENGQSSAESARTPTVSEPSLPSYDKYNYGSYEESDAVVKAYDNYKRYESDGKPIEYSSAWKDELDGIMSQIMNREKFSYDVNSDALYKQYADIYQANAKNAMKEAMAQTSALSGGYGSSYSQTAGQQAYAAEMDNLNSIIPSLYAQAAERYASEGNDLYSKYNLLAAQEDEDYAKYRDELSDYQTERDRLYDLYVNEYTKDYSEYADKRDFDYTLNRDAVSDSQWRESLDYQKDRDAVSDSQWRESLDYQKDRDAVSDSQWRESLDYQKDRDAVSDSQWRESLDYQKDRDAVSDSQWRESLDYQKDRDAVSDSQWQQEFDRNGEWHEDSLNQSTGTSVYKGEGVLNGETVPSILASVPGLTTTKTSFFDDDGYFKVASVASYNTNSYGETTGVVWNIGGKEVSLQVGVSPYTMSKNPDVANGTFDNGYQPDNVGGKKLEEAVKYDSSYDYDYINGVKQVVYVEPESGALYIWDDTVNEYLDYGGLSISKSNTDKDGTDSAGTTDSTGGEEGETLTSKTVNNYLSSLKPNSSSSTSGVPYAPKDEEENKKTWWELMNQKWR